MPSPVQRHSLKPPPSLRQLEHAAPKPQPEALSRPASDVHRRDDGDRFDAAVGGERPMQGGGALRTDRVAAATYRRHRNDQPLSLTDRGEVARLISRSPQLDSVPGAENDGSRCGGASMVNAMLLDGRHVQNAQAIRDTAARHPRVEVSRQEDAAVSAMTAGRMRPADVAHLQDLMYRLGRDQPVPPGSGNGLTTPQMRSLLGELRGGRAFQGSADVNFHMTQQGTTNHWTTTVTRNDGSRSFADSWPRPARPDDNAAQIHGRGYAPVGSGWAAPMPSQESADGSFDPRFRADLTLDGQGLRERQYAESARPAPEAGATPGLVMETRYPVRDGHVVFSERSRFFRDPDHWAVQSSVPVGLAEAVARDD